MNTRKEQQEDVHDETPSEEGNANEPTARPANAAAGTSAAPMTDAESIEYASSYLSAVRGVLRLNGKESEFDKLVNLLVDYRKRRIGMDKLVTGVQQVLIWHPVLIYGFNTFLPEQRKIIPWKAKRIRNIKQEAVKFVKKLRVRFHYDHESFGHFIGLLDGSRYENGSLLDVYEEILAIFHDNYDLLDEFGKFLPGPYLLGV